MVNNSPKTNLAGRVEEQLPAAVVSFIRKAGDLAQREQEMLYLVGGVVRDILLNRVNLDLDLVVEGDAINLAKRLADINRATIKTHPRFGTAKLQWHDRSIDVAMARAESYDTPGALPRVKPGTIEDDLARRDFTINAMAIELNPRHFGELLDPHSGKSDLNAGLIRVLHEKSFIDDATRIWRALRYEQRLDFHIEPKTLRLLKRDINKLSTISGTRIRRELERILEEELPEKVLRRADELGVLRILHPALKGDKWLSETFALAGERYDPDPPPLLYLALLSYRLTEKDTEQLISYLKLPKSTTQVLHDTQAIKVMLQELAVPGLAPSRIYELLHGHSTISLIASALAVEATAAAENIALYLDILKNARPLLTGKDIMRLGVPEGPRVKEALLMLREAKLDGKIDTRKDEEEMVKEWLNG
jgi:tRNA nucleotidyltransferase (CCA-adding enzyme)